jgi:hypothetical protein
MQASKRTVLPPDLCNGLEVTAAVGKAQLIQCFLGLASEQKGLGNEINHMSKAPEAPAPALLLIHPRIELAKNKVHASIIRRGVV